MVDLFREGAIKDDVLRKATVPTLFVGETLISAKTQDGESVGLPEIGAQCTVDILYDEAEDVGGSRSVKLIDPLTDRYTAVEATEEKTIAALRDYARLVRGRYPSRLALATVIAEATAILDLLKEPERCGVVLVARAEALPVAEAPLPTARST